MNRTETLCGDGRSLRFRELDRLIAQEAEWERDRMRRGGRPKGSRNKWTSQPKQFQQTQGK